MGSGVIVVVGTKVGKKTVGVGAGGVGIGVGVGAGFVLTQEERSSVQAVIQTAGNWNRLFLPPQIRGTSPPKPLSASLRGRIDEQGSSHPCLGILLPLQTA